MYHGKKLRSLVSQSKRLYTDDVGEKDWLQDFETGHDRLRVHFVTDHGGVVRVVVIQYEAYIDGQWHAIVRYDEAHGFFHKDVMSPASSQEKIIQPAPDKAKALLAAITEIKQNWREYRRKYEASYHEKH